MNEKHLRLLELTPETYQVAENERHLFHVRMYVKRYTPDGTLMYPPEIHKFGAKAFEGTLMNSFRRLGYTIDILYNPKEWLAVNSLRINNNAAAPNNDKQLRSLETKIKELEKIIDKQQPKRSK